TELDGMIANIYGLTCDEFEYILTTFPLVPQTQKEAALACFLTFKEQADHSTEESRTWKALIEQGESNSLEFKSTLRCCLRQKSPQKYIEHAVMKTIAAYLNSEGGTLLIGVDDSGGILGLDDDFSTFSNKKPDKVDEFLKHFDNLIATNFGDHVHHYLNIAIAPIEGKALCAVTVKEQASDAVWLMNKEKNAEQFYIRRSASTIELSPSEAMKYIRDHWK
ncbi:MAG: ATP-binding protein, partial [bacterium]|nr:ATP-binding protein [bacterium]